MKFSMNGALTIGTLDGANVEIREEVGNENFFLFGMNAHEVWSTEISRIQSRQYMKNNPELKEIIEFIPSGHFSGGNQIRSDIVTDSMTLHDPYMVLADYASYLACQESVSATYLDQEESEPGNLSSILRVWVTFLQTGLFMNIVKKFGMFLLLKTNFIPDESNRSI